MTIEKIKSMTVEEFLLLNQNTESYWNHWRWLKDDSTDWKQQPRAIEAAKIDLALFTERLEQFEAYPTPIVGQWIKGYDGKMTRFTHAWDDGIQTGGGQGSFYLNTNGHASYSGGLDPSVSYDLLELTDERKDGQFWIFHRGWSGAHKGVYYNHPCKVWKLKPIDKIQDVKRLPYQYKVVEVTEDVYDYALEVLPPHAMQNSFFAMGEAYSHNGKGEPIFYCFIQAHGKFYCTIATVKEAGELFRNSLFNSNAN